jgi:hypothetical protein
MMKTNINRVAMGLAMGSTLFVSLIALPASASTVRGADASTTLSAVITKADGDISERLTSLSDLSAKVQAMKNISSDEKTNISNLVADRTVKLNAIKTTVDADTDIKTAKTDRLSIFGPIRIYALVIPQGYIEVAVDRINTVGSMMTTLVSKLQAGLDRAKTAGHDVTSLQTALNDVSTQVAAALTSATTANNTVSGLVPDNGDKTIAASNKTALESGRASVKSASANLKTAASDIKTVITGLKAFNVTATSSASVTQ